MRGGKSNSGKAASEKSGKALSPKPATPSARPTPPLDFPGRTTIRPHEAAAAIGCHVDHIYDLADEGVLKAVNISGGNNLTDRRCLRIPVEAWRQFLLARSTS